MDDLTKLVSVLPAHWQLWGLLILSAVPLLGRAYHALINGGGLVGIWRGVVFGTNTPAAKQLSLFVLGVALVVGVTGCAGQNRIAFRAVGTAQALAEHSVSAYNAWKQTHAVDAATDAQVRQKVAAYKAAANEWIDVQEALLAVPADGPMLARAAAVQSELLKCAVDLWTLVQTVGVVK